MSAWNPRANRNTFWASVFVGELARGGVAHACISPGSRSTPLTLALATQPEIETFTLLDERGAAFFALGLAKASGRPAALVCTSGTAAANYLPAVVEASLSNVPLLVLTADRPPLLRDTGAGQAIDQLKLYGDHTRWFFEVGEPVIREDDLRRLRRLAAQALATARGHSATPAGPVQLNFPFRKPLEAQPVPEDFPPHLDDHPLAVSGLPDAPFSHASSAPAPADTAVVESIAARVLAAPRGLILCGPMTGLYHDGGPGSDNGSGEENAWPAAVSALARHTGYPVLAEPPSGVIDGSAAASYDVIVPHAELVLNASAFREQLAPGLVLRFGGEPTGIAAEILLAEHPDSPLVLVNEEGAWLDTTHHEAQLVRTHPVLFCRQLSARLEALREGRPADRSWMQTLTKAGAVASGALAVLYDIPAPEGLAGEWFEGRVFAELAALVPRNAIQFTASSMPVRDLAAFTPLPGWVPRHLVNRGANGIDGTLSSALGAAAAHRNTLAAAAHRGTGAPSVLVTGDVAFHHDANALLAARQYDIPLTVVLINNDGGGIFEMLPIAEYGELHETYFGTPHGIDFAALCAAYGVPHHLPEDWDAFRQQVRDGLASGSPSVIEVRSDRRKNRARQLMVRQAVADALARAFPPGRVL
ncbi:MAG: 2-succinyl-5-enolpyruvyl-6-hydroxy-3-cyclohexene-1-carboxylic-acid synthase [bacterium]